MQIFIYTKFLYIITKIIKNNRIIPIQFLNMS